MRVSLEAIETIAKNRVNAFATSFYGKKPVILEGFLNDWKALQWTPSYFAERLGDATIRVDHNDPAEGTFLQQTITDSYQTMTFRNYIQALDTLNAQFAIREDVSLFRRFPFLSKECNNFLPFAAPNQKLNSHYHALWFGPSSYVTGLHADDVHNILVQLSGTKLIMLFAPDQTPLLYLDDPQILNHPDLKKKLGGWYKKFLQYEVRWSQVDPFKPNYEQFPLLQDAQYWITLLKPSQALHIPEGWWHSVLAIDTSISVSVEISPKSELLQGVLD